MSVADLLATPRLARVYAFYAREGPATVGDVIEARDLSQGTAYADVDRLTDAGLLCVTDETQPRTYTARGIGLTVTSDDRTYTITPALVDAVGRRVTSDEIDAYIDRHGVAGLATALEYALARERGAVTHRTVAEELDHSPLAAESILQALRPVVTAHYEIEPSGGSLAAVDERDP